MRSTQRQHDQAEDRAQVTVEPWVSQTLAWPILCTAVKRKIVTRTKIVTKA